MSEMRTSCRVRRRLPVVFVDGQRSCRGLTANLSRTGLCLHSDYVVAPRTELMLTLTLPGIAEVRTLAVVEWARKLRGTDTLETQNSMGLRFLTPPGADYDAFMTMIEGLAQAHGLTTRRPPTTGAPAAHREPPLEPASLRHEPPARAPASPRHRPFDPRREPETPAPAPLPQREPASRARPVDPRREPASRARPVDPRREPAPAPPPRRRVYDATAPIVEVQARRAEPAPTRSRPEKNLDFVVGPDDLAAPPGYPCSLSTARVAWLLEQGAAELVTPRLRPRTTTAGLSLEVDVPQEPLAIGTPLSVTIALAALGADLRSFSFEIEVTAGARLVATGRHVRVVVESPAS